MVIACLLIFLRVGWVFASFCCDAVFLFADFSVAYPCYVAGAAALDYISDLDDVGSGGCIGGDDVFVVECADLWIPEGTAV